MIKCGRFGEQQSEIPPICLTDLIARVRLELAKKSSHLLILGKKKLIVCRYVTYWNDETVLILSFFIKKITLQTKEYLPGTE